MKLYGNVIIRRRKVCIDPKLPRLPVRGRADWKCDIEEDFMDLCPFFTLLVSICSTT